MGWSSALHVHRTYARTYVCTSRATRHDTTYSYFTVSITPLRTHVGGPVDKSARLP